MCFGLLVLYGTVGNAVLTTSFLRQLPFVIRTRSSTARGLDKAFRKAKLPLPRYAMTCGTLTGLEVLVRHSDLVGAIPLEVHRLRSAASGLCQLALQEEIEGPRVAIVRWADAHPTPAASDLEDAFLQAAQRLARRNR